MKALHAAIIPSLSPKDNPIHWPVSVSVGTARGFLWIPGFRGVSTSPGQGNPTAWGKREHKPPESGLVCARAGFLHQPAAEQSEVQPQGEKWPTG